ncbi:unnamed protein product [Diabrotica balteata]|uniref:Uncharacterized protein n=1 Tax=Diabrotica balteata TaxID=107213 RepID=A0A9N9SWD9_DIABA|nr:unnamed protein product [Diabrotica balteata]
MARPKTSDKEEELKEKIPSVVTSEAWREYHSQKENEKKKKEEEKNQRKIAREQKRILKEKPKRDISDDDGEDEEWVESGSSCDDIDFCDDPNKDFCPLTHGELSVGNYVLVKFLGGVIVAMYGNDRLAIYNDKNTFKITLNQPSIYPFSKKLLIIDSACNFYTWHVETGVFISITNNHILEPVTFNVGAFSPHKSVVAAFFDQLGIHFCHIYSLDVEINSVKLLKRLKFTEKMTTAKFSCDGSLLAVGMASGSIKVYNLDENYKETILNLHEDPIQDLTFSPHKEPILVSMGEEIAWWNLRLLRPFQKTERRGRRPNSLDILEDLTSDFSSMDVSFWSERQPVKGSPCLLSCIKLNDKVKYMSASNDFNSFLTIDVTGKVYIMDIILPACEDL